MSLERAEDHDGGQAERVEILQPVDLGEELELGPGLTVEASTRAPARRRRRDTDIPPPRRWRRIDPRTMRACPQCHAVVGGVKEGFWHQAAQHGAVTEDQADIDEWIEDHAQDLEELRAAVRGGAGRWRNTGPNSLTDLFFGGGLAASLIGLMCLMAFAAVVAVVVLIFSLH